MITAREQRPKPETAKTAVQRPVKEKGTSAGKNALCGGQRKVRRRAAGFNVHNKAGCRHRAKRDRHRQEHGGFAVCKIKRQRAQKHDQHRCGASCKILRAEHKIAECRAGGGIKVIFLFGYGDQRYGKRRNALQHNILRQQKSGGKICRALQYATRLFAFHGVLNFA